jgi:hypothetical protein
MHRAVRGIEDVADHVVRRLDPVVIPASIPEVLKLVSRVQNWTADMRVGKLIETCNSHSLIVVLYISDMSVLL